SPLPDVFHVSIPIRVVRLRRGNPLGSTGHFITFFFFAEEKILLKKQLKCYGQGKSLKTVMFPHPILKSI
uniref:Uncharacterized protein n=1 Tax=Athene cunicularia TaxID=194338 RepID=A0A663NBR3_ATHCN